MKNWKAHLALVFVTIFYGANYNIAKDIMPHNLLPFTLTFVRITVVFVLFWLLFFVIRSKEKIDKKDIFKLFICGLTGVTLNQSLFLWGLSLTSPINASIIVVTTPIVVLIFSYFMLKEELSIKKILGVLLGLLGSFILLLGSSKSNNINVNFKGDVIVFLNVISYSFYLVYVKTLMKKYKPLTVIRWIFLFGFICILPIAFNNVKSTEWQNVSIDVWLSVAYVVLFSTFGTYLLNIYALKKVNASMVGFYIYFQVIIATAITVYLGKDTLNLNKIISCLLIFTAVFLVGNFNFKKKKILNSNSNG